MKTTMPLQRVDEPACATPRRPRRGVVSCALVGFGIGVGSATAYILMGGEYLLDIPRWASVVFFPGFLVGFKVNAWGLDKDVSRFVGVLAVGLAYAALAILARFPWIALKHRRRSAALRQTSG
jgi:hypothetical protein